jgi:hypothetical protein
MDDGGHSYGITVGRGKQEARCCRLPVLIPWTMQLRAMLLSGRLVPPQHLQQAGPFSSLGLQFFLFDPNPYFICL